jgi:hypothetical protein
VSADLSLQPCLSCRERLPRSRGLCPPCYGRCGRAVRAGQTTWAQLETEGLILPWFSIGTTGGWPLRIPVE